MPMTDTELSDAIAALPYDKVTQAGIEARIVDNAYAVLPDTTITICHLTMENGFSVRGESACVDRRNFDVEIGQEMAYRDALSKLWPLEGYLLAERRWRSTRNLS